MQARFHLSQHELHRLNTKWNIEHNSSVENCIKSIVYKQFIFLQNSAIQMYLAFRIKINVFEQYLSCLDINYKYKNNV